MSTPTRKEIIDAHEALETLCARVPEDTPAYTMKSLILAALPPRPQPTMADVVWDDDLHYLAEAESEEFGRAIMLQKGTNQLITCFLLENPNYRVIVFFPKDLTLTGKRYTLTEVQE